jgi:hypothetical protein
LAVANNNSNTVSVFRNTAIGGSIGSGSFAVKQDFATGTRPISVAIGDLDGDGKPDLAVANWGSFTVSVFRNTATIGSINSSSFAAKVDFTTGAGSYPNSVAIGDLDGDGKPDLAVANNNLFTVSVLRNTATIGSIGSGSFAAKQDFVTGAQPWSVAIGDLDGDGKPDLAVVNNASNTVSVFRNTATSGSIGSGSFAAKQDFTTGTNPGSVAIGDLDGDGKPDLVLANQSSNTVSVLRNTATSGSIGSGSFAAKQDFATGAAPQQSAIGDIDGDGKPDLAVANDGGLNTVSVLRNTATSGSIGSGSFAVKQDFTANNPYSLAIGDIDGDGRPDLVLANATSNTVSVLRNAGQYNNALSIDYNQSTTISNHYSISPNPFKETFTLNIALVASENIEITIADPIGKIIKKEQYHINIPNQKVEISDLNTLSTGIYYVTIKDGVNILTKKIIKNN